MHLALGSLIVLCLFLAGCGAGGDVPARQEEPFFIWVPGEQARLAGQPLDMPLLEGATMVESPVGKAALPAKDGRIATTTVDLADTNIPPQGTIDIWVRLDRTIRNTSADNTVSGTLLGCEDLRVALQEKPNGSGVDVRAAILDRDPPGRVGLAHMDLTHLRGDQWYHIALLYDAPKGLWRMVLNGVLQPEPWPHGPFTFQNEMQRIEIGGLLVSQSAEAEPVRVAVGPIRWRAGWTDAEEIRESLEAIDGWSIPPNHGEGVLEETRAVDVDSLCGEVIYQNDFSEALKDEEWVLEGPAEVTVEDGMLSIRSDEHCVLWLKKKLPRDFVATWDIQPSQVDGLTIAFLSAMGTDGRDLFDPSLPPRDGDFQQYIRGEVACYHCSYWAGTRGSANMRKNPGFYMIGMGPDVVGEKMMQGEKGPFRVAVIRRGPRIECVAEGQRFLIFEDDGETYGPVHGNGYFGLRQMGQSKHVRYDNLTIHTIAEN